MPTLGESWCSAAFCPEWPYRLTVEFVHRTWREGFARSSFQLLLLAYFGVMVCVSGSPRHGEGPRRPLFRPNAALHPLLPYVPRGPVALQQEASVHGKIDEERSAWQDFWGFKFVVAGFMASTTDEEPCAVPMQTRVDLLGSMGVRM